MSNVAHEYRKMLEQGLSGKEGEILTLLSQKVDKYTSDLGEHEKEVLQAIEERADEMVERE